MENDISVTLGRIVLLGIVVVIWILSKKTKKVEQSNYDRIETKYSHLVDKMINILANDDELNK